VPISRRYIRTDRSFFPASPASGRGRSALVGVRIVLDHGSRSALPWKLHRPRGFRRSLILIISMPFRSKVVSRSSISSRNGLLPEANRLLRHRAGSRGSCPPAMSGVLVVFLSRYAATKSPLLTAHQRLPAYRVAHSQRHVAGSRAGQTTGNFARRSLAFCLNNSAPRRLPAAGPVRCPSRTLELGPCLSTFNIDALTEKPLLAKPFHATPFNSLLATF